MTQPPAPPIGLQGIGSHGLCKDICRTGLPLPNFPPGTHYFDPKKHNLIEGVSKSADKKPRLSSKSIVKHKDHTMESTLMAQK